jgi:signal transduction histidine kinase
MILDEIAERITGRWALSFKGWLYLTILGILGTKSRTYALLDITQLESFLLAISVHLLNAPLYYFFAQKLLKKRFTEPLSLLSVLASFLLFMLTISISEIIITIYVFDQTAYLGPQLFAPLFPSLFGFIASSYLLAEFDQNRKDIQRLAFAKSTLEKTAQESQDQIVAERSQLISAIQDSVFYQLDALKKQFSLLGSNPRRGEIERLANELEEYSANTIRSLSHEIAEDVSKKNPIDRLSFVGSLNIKKSVNDYHPYISFKLAILGMIIIGGNHEASLSGYKGFLLQLAAALILSPILFLGKIATRKYSPNNLYVGFASYLLTIFLSGYVLTALVSSDFIKNLEIRNEYSPIVYSARTLSGIIMASLIVTIVEARRNTLNNLVAMNEKLQVEIDWMDNRSSELRKELASILHGPLQGRIAGIAMALRLNAEEEDLSDEEKSKKLEDIERLLQTVIHDVQELFKVEKNQPEASIIIKLIKLRRSWEGIATVSWRIEPKVFAILGASYFKTISDILYEAVSNSVRHGGATAVSVAINADANNLILEITDDGKGVKQLPIPGAGFRKFSEFGATYSFDLSVKQGAKMIVLLPIIS